METGFFSNSLSNSESHCVKQPRDPAEVSLQVITPGKESDNQAVLQEQSQADTLNV